MNTMSFLPINALIIAGIISVAILSILVIGGWKTRINRFFFAAVFFAILWLLGTYVFLIGPSVEVARLGIQLFYIAPMFTITFLSLFAMLFPKKGKPIFVFANSVLLAVTILFAVFIAANPNFLTSEINLSTSLNELVVHASSYIIYSVYFNVAFFIAFAGLAHQALRQRGKERQQLIAIFLGTFATAMFSLVTNLTMPTLGNTSLIWLGPTCSLFYIGALSYSIIKHQLFDIKLAAVRSLAYFLAVITFSGLYYFSAYLISRFIFNTGTTNAFSTSPLNIALALLLAFVFQPLKRFFDHFTNKLFYRDRYDPQDFYERFSELLASSTNLRGLLAASAIELASTFKAEQGFLYIRYRNAVKHHMSAGTQNHHHVTERDILILNDYFEKSLTKSQDKILLVDSLENSNPLRTLFRRYQIAIALPLIKEKTIIGYVFLGNHLSGSYTQQDIDALLTISNSLVIAIQNMLSLHEVREINATLQQRIDIATKELRDSNTKLRHIDQVKDEFISMASHQLRTPLTSVKGYMSMVLEGDAGNISPQQRHLLTEAFKSSERMVHLIADFLSVSRLQTGKFVLDQQQSNLEEVVKQEIDALKLVAKSHNMQLVYKRPEHTIPLLTFDEAKIRQVVMNFIDNAIYYSRGNATIAVALELDTNKVSFTVTDTGIGVPKSEQQHLFTKFFRAKNARRQRPDGTGIGLFLAKKVITAHGGSVIFHSVEGKGSTFGFRLPL